jgi:hypothetical protein
MEDELVEWVESDYSAETTMRFARSGALVRILAAGDACEVCQARASRVYLPSDVPRLPVRGCLNERCRCTFVAVDPETKQTVAELVRWGAQVVKQGRITLARRILRRAVTLDEWYESGWLWLSAAVEDEDRVSCLEKVLELNPRNEQARAGLELLRRGTRPPTAEDAPTRRPSVVTSQTMRSAPPESVPRQVLEIRQERQVILGQWQQFVGFAVNTDAHTLLAQGRAFLNKWDDLGGQALSLLTPNARLDELNLQLQESEEMIDALFDLMQGGPVPGESSEHEMPNAVRSLIQQLRERQDALRDDVYASGPAK